jgi:hypothetical protein
MAFNPFHRFRKHQKVFFAILTIICMITFVFQFGAGDPFTRIMGWFGAGRNRGDKVITLYGDTVRTGQIEQLRRQRRLAQDFMKIGMLLKLSEGEERLAEQVRNVPPDSPGSSPLPSDVRDIPGLLPRRLQEAFQGGLPRGARESRFEQALAELGKIRRAFLLPSVQDKPEQLKTLDAVANALAFEAFFLNPERKSDEFLFGGRSSKDEDLLDFLIWKHQADKLGITLTEIDVIRELNRGAGSSLPQKPWLPEEPFERNSIVHFFLRPDRERRKEITATPKELFEALLEEIRVQLAKEVLLGHGSGIREFLALAEPMRESPTTVTPAEFLDYYREHRTTLKVAMLPIKVADFTGKVEGQPSEKELVGLYEAYKDKVPNPASSQPGFKEPRRIRLQYASVNPESPFYTAEAAKMAKALSIYSDAATSAALRVAAGVNPYAAGGGPAWLSIAALPSAFDPLHEEYERYLREENDLAAGRKNFADEKAVAGGTSGFDLRDRTPFKERPTVYASLVGQLLGSGLDGSAFPLAGASILPGLETLYERTTLRVFGTTVLAGGSGSPLIALGLPACVTHSAQPRQVVQPLLVQRFEKGLAQRLIIENTESFQERLSKLKSKPAEAEKYVEEAAKKFGFQNFNTTHLDSSYQMADDPSFKALKDAWDNIRKEPMVQQLNRGPLSPLLDMLFGSGPSLYQPLVFPRPDFAPFMGLKDKDIWAYWLIENKPERVRPFDEVRKEAEESWRFDRARKKAYDEADRINGELKKMHFSPTDAVRFLRDQKHGTESEFELDNVARLVEPARPQMIPGSRDRAEFFPYVVPTDKIAYPPPNFVQDLLTLKAVGDSTVIADKPRKHYYVAVLLTRSVPTFHEFSELYGKGPQGDPLWGMMMGDRRRDLDQDLMRQLRVEAAGKDNVNPDGTLKLPESIRIRETSSEGGE